jgi:hypothetical protein
MTKDEMLEEIADYENQIVDIVNGLEQILAKIPGIPEWEKRKYRSPDCLGALSRLASMGNGYEAAFGNGPTLQDLQDLVSIEMDEEEEEDEE